MPVLPHNPVYLLYSIGSHCDPRSTLYHCVSWCVAGLNVWTYLQHNAQCNCSSSTLCKFNTLCTVYCGVSLGLMFGPTCPFKTNPQQSTLSNTACWLQSFRTSGQYSLQSSGSDGGLLGNIILDTKHWLQTSKRAFTHKMCMCMQRKILNDEEPWAR